MVKEVQVSVIIINYNGLRFLSDCLHSLIENLKGLVYEIIIWDNASTDNSRVFIQSHFPDVKFISSPENLGFGKGNNEAVKHATGKYILLLNNDTVLLQPVKPLLEIMDSDPTVGLLGVKMLDGNGQYIPSVGRFPKPNSLFYMKRMSDYRTDFKTGVFKKPIYEVDWLGGSFLLTSLKNFQKIKGFDPDYFMYVEDVELNKRYYDAGLKNIFVSTYSYKHFGGFNPKKNHYLIQGYRLYIDKHFKGLQKFAALFMLEINATVKKLKGNYS